jgi:UDP-N-acetylmuramyl tripeptide synthase
MTFDELLMLVRSPASPDEPASRGGPNPPPLCDDSRLAKPGCIFVAVKGPNVDGHDFISQALSSGAKYIVCQSKPSSVIPAKAGIQFAYSVIPAKAGIQEGWWSSRNTG